MSDLQQKFLTKAMEESFNLVQLRLLEAVRHSLQKIFIPFLHYLFYTYITNN